MWGSDVGRVFSRAEIAGMVVGGGGGERLGGVSKPDLVFGGSRLIDRVCCALSEVAGAGLVAVVPPGVSLPPGVMRTLEDPPGGGPWPGSTLVCRPSAPPRTRGW